VTFASSAVAATTVVGATARMPRHSEASMIRSADGRLLLAWSAFAETHVPAPGTTTEDPTAREWAHSRDNNPAEIRVLTGDGSGDGWGDERSLVDNDAGINVMQPAFARLSGGDLGLSYSRRQSARDARRFFVRSADEGRSWSAPVDVAGLDGYVTAAHDRLLTLRSGRILQPCHRLHDGRISSFAAWSDDGGTNWRLSNELELEHPVPGALYGFWEASVAERADGSLLMAGRTALGEVFGSVSTDAGETWSAPQPLGVTAPSAPSMLRSLGADRLLLVHNTAYRPGELMQGPRTPLVASVSDDGGENWWLWRTLEADPEHWFHYVSCLVEPDAVRLSYSVTNPATRLWSLAILTSDVPEFSAGR
jgi:hypothetical protein